MNKNIYYIENFSSMTNEYYYINNVQIDTIGGNLIEPSLTIDDYSTNKLTNNEMIDQAIERLKKNSNTLCFSVTYNEEFRITSINFHKFIYLKKVVSKKNLDKTQFFIESRDKVFLNSKYLGIAQTFWYDNVKGHRFKYNLWDNSQIFKLEGIKIDTSNEDTKTELKKTDYPNMTFDGFINFCIDEMNEKKYNSFLIKYNGFITIKTKKETEKIKKIDTITLLKLNKDDINGSIDKEDNYHMISNIYIKNEILLSENIKEALYKESSWKKKYKDIIKTWTYDDFYKITSDLKIGVMSVFNYEKNAKKNKMTLKDYSELVKVDRSKVDYPTGIYQANYIDQADIKKDTWYGLYLYREDYKKDDQDNDITNDQFINIAIDKMNKTKDIKAFIVRYKPVDINENICTNRKKEIEYIQFKTKVRPISANDYNYENQVFFNYREKTKAKRHYKKNKDKVSVSIWEIPDGIFYLRSDIHSKHKYKELPTGYLNLNNKNDNDLDNDKIVVKLERKNYTSDETIIEDAIKKMNNTEEIKAFIIKYKKVKLEKNKKKKINEIIFYNKLNIEKLPASSFSKNGWREVFFKQIDYDQVKCKLEEKKMSTKIKRYGDKEEIEKNKEIQSVYKQELKQDAIELKQQIKQDNADLKQCAKKLNQNVKDTVNLDKCKVKIPKSKEIQEIDEEITPICFNSIDCRNIFKKNDLLNKKAYSLISKIGITENNINESKYILRKINDYGISRFNVIVGGLILGISVNFVLFVLLKYFYKKIKENV